MKTLLAPIALLAALILMVLAMTPQPPAQAEKPLIETVVQAEVGTGPGFFPAPKNNTCQCGDLEKRVAALEAKVASYGTARPVASSGSAGQSGGVVVAKPATTSGLPSGSVVVSERVVSSQPVQSQSATVVRRGLFGGQYQVQSPQSCRIVNGVRVCN